MNSYLEKLFSLAGKVALITGASSGIGRALVEAFVSAGAITIGIGRSLNPDESFNLKADYRQCDVLNSEKFFKVCEAIFSSQGRLDVLVNAAGITQSTNNSEDASKIFEQTLTTNLIAAHNTCQIAAKFMKKNGVGSIINITSIASVLGFPENPAYVASKGGLRMLTKALALDLAADGIRVNNLAPGYVRTKMTEASFEDPIRHAQRLEHMMIKRWAMPEDMVGAAIFLASNASAYITGTDLFVDGGWTSKGL